MEKIFKDYAKSKAKAKANYSKFKRTGSKFAKRRADYHYAICDAMNKKFENPATTVNVRQNNINDSFKFSKQTTNGVHNPKIAVKSSSQRLNYKRYKKLSFK